MNEIMRQKLAEAKSDREWNLMLVALLGEASQAKLRQALERIIKRDERRTDQ